MIHILEDTVLENLAQILQNKRTQSQASNVTIMTEHHLHPRQMLFKMHIGAQQQQNSYLSYLALKGK